MSSTSTCEKEIAKYKTKLAAATEANNKAMVAAQIAHINAQKLVVEKMQVLEKDDADREQEKDKLVA